MTISNVLQQISLRRVGLTVLLALMVVSVGVVAASAESLQPWFHLSSIARPGNLVSPSLAVSEVQEIAVSATEGDFVLEDTGTGANDEIPPLPYDATHQEVQAVLEGFYGAGNVEVSGGPGDKEGTDPYVVTFTGDLALKNVALIGVRSFPEPYETFKPLAGGTRTEAIEAREVTKGALHSSELIISAINLGNAPANGFASPVRIVDRLPMGLKALVAEADSQNNASNEDGATHCTVVSAHVVECVFTEGELPPFDQLEVGIKVGLEAGAHSGEVNEASVVGGGAPAVSVTHPLVISGARTPFGVEDFEVSPEELGGALDTQAGSHPYQLTTTLNLNETSVPNSAFRETGNSRGNVVEAAALPKDVNVKLPAGLIGNPTAYPRCSLSEFARHLCAADTALGVAAVTYFSSTAGLARTPTPIYNVEPSVGEPARLAFAPVGVPVYLDTSVRTGEDYGITVHVPNIPQNIGFLSATVTIWGVPGDPSHNNVRGIGCLAEAEGVGGQTTPCEAEHSTTPPPFLALPTSCTGKPLQTDVSVDSWADPAAPVSAEPEAAQAMPTLDGCGLLPFAGSISTAMDASSGSTPSGLTVDVHVPQEQALNPEGLAPSDLKNITVTLPEGLVLNPAAADGLTACTEEQIGLSNDNEVTCPDASKVAEATISTPLLPNPLTGFVYLASPQNFSTLSGAPQENPFASLVAMYVVVRDPVSGVLVKLPGSVSLSATGQITATFANDPQLPFEDAELHFFGGERAPLATPARCGAYTTSASLEPWAQGATGEEVVHAASTFDISSGPGGSACPGAALPFTPSLSSETTNINAGSFTPLSTTLSREDGQQSIRSVTLHYPAGLSGILAGVKLCGEAEANAGTCPAASAIGETIVSVGLGGDPFTVKGGKAYLTEKYDGAPFGLSIVNPAEAGPFDLQEGRPVVVRAKVEVDPHTSALTITTDPPGSPHAIPTIIEGIPLQIKHVNVLVNRPGFTFNPTSCNQTAITGAIASAEGSTSPVSVPFQVTNCSALKFTPSISFSTNGKTSKQDGADLITKVTYPSAPQGTYANVGYVKVELPKALPSRLTTLQKACLAKVFEASPAACPPESKIGYATVHTPLLPVPLTGPAIFVSHGGEEFPSLTMVLQGYGVTIDLVGTTFISKAGVTSTTFKTVPDQPFSSFELTLPQGPYSALTANGNLCTQKLVIPNEFLSQAGGAPLKQDSVVNVTGCKPTITVITHKVKGKTATLQVHVPAAGRLVATAKGLSKASKVATGASTLTVRLSLTSGEAAVLAKHKGRKLRARVKLTFIPKKGKKLKTSTTVVVG